MAKKRRVVPARSHVYQAGSVRPGFSRRQPPPRPRRSGIPTSWLLAGGAIAIAALLGGAYLLGFFGGAPGTTPQPSSVAAACTDMPTTTPPADFVPAPPVATPLAAPPAAPAGDGTRAFIETAEGCIVMELYNQSAPVATENFINLANGGYYDGVVFHRLVPDFMIQGGDPDGTGTGGPGYTIQDEPVVGEYTRGVVAMARTSAPNSQGSQFFIVVADSQFLAGGGYTIFGRVLSGMEVVDQIVGMPTANDDQGGRGGTALDPVIMERVRIEPAGSV